LKDKFVVVLSTCSNFDEAKKIAKSLLEKKLAACINIVPNIYSMYTWKHKIEEATEFLLFIKTKASFFNKVKKDILSNHSYTVVEVLSLDIKQGNLPYLKWIDENTIPSSK